MKRTIILLGSVMLLAVLSIHAVVAGNGRQEGPTLAELALQEGELPGGEIRLMGKGALSPDDTSHPLNRQNLSSLGLPEQALAYREGYQIALVTNDASRLPLFIGNYLYRYEDAGSAQAVARGLWDALLRASPDAVAVRYEPTSADKSAVEGQAAIFQGKEGTTLHWFVGTREDVLILLIVEGAPAARETFDGLVGRLLER